MTLVGKILIVLILIMSLVFMGFAIALYSTQTNWYLTVNRSRADAQKLGKPVGLKLQLEDLKAENKDLRQKLLKADAEFEEERARKEFQLAKAESERQRLEKLQTNMQARNDALIQDNRQLNATISTAQKDLNALTAEVNTLREEIRVAQKNRDEIFQEVVARTEEVHQHQGDLARQEERVAQLVDQLVALKNPPDAPAPKIDGKVTGIYGKDLIEISLGSDDGLRKGHTVEVFRGRSYLGRARIVKTAPSQAVAEMLKEYQKGIIQKGDRVATRLDVS